MLTLTIEDRDRKKAISMPIAPSFLFDQEKGTITISRNQAIGLIDSLSQAERAFRKFETDALLDSNQVVVRQNRKRIRSAQAVTPARFLSGVFRSAPGFVLNTA